MALDNPEETNMEHFNPLGNIFISMPQTFWMLLAEPEPQEVTVHKSGRASVGRPPRVVFDNEEDARRAAARLAHELGRKMYLLQVVDSCEAPPPEPPPVMWASAPKALDTVEAEDE